MGVMVFKNYYAYGDKLNRVAINLDKIVSVEPLDYPATRIITDTHIYYVSGSFDQIVNIVNGYAEPEITKKRKSKVSA